jgi:hypothetical protein
MNSIFPMMRLKLSKVFNPVASLGQRETNGLGHPPNDTLLLIWSDTLLPFINPSR